MAAERDENRKVIINSCYRKVQKFYFNYESLSGKISVLVFAT